MMTAMERGKAGRGTGSVGWGAVDLSQQRPPCESYISAKTLSQGKEERVWGEGHTRQGNKRKGLEVGLAWQVQGAARRPVWLKWLGEWEAKEDIRSGREVSGVPKSGRS